MKYIFFVVLVALALSIAGGTVLAVDEPTNGLPTTGVPSNAQELLDRVNTIGNWVFAIFLAISIIYILMAAAQFVTGGPEKVGEARQKLIFAIIGIAIALLATGFDDILRSILIEGAPVAP